MVGIFRPRITLIKSIVLDYLRVSQALMFPSVMLARSLEAIITSFGHEWVDMADEDVAREWIRNTSQTFKVPPDTEGCNFHKLYSGKATRLEIIGLVGTIAVSAQGHGFPVPFHGTAGNPKGKDFWEDNLRIVKICVDASRVLTPRNDLTLWLLRSELNQTIMVHGDCSMLSNFLSWESRRTNSSIGPNVYTKLGEITTEIFSFGLHREPKSSQIPPFLLEMRRRLYTGVYQFDKAVATFLGRPPRLCRRHSDVKTPVDLTDEEVAGSQADFDQGLAMLDEQGWKRTPELHTSTWLQPRYLLGVIREDVLEISLGGPEAQTVQCIK